MIIATDTYKDLEKKSKPILGFVKHPQNRNS